MKKFCKPFLVSGFSTRTPRTRRSVPGHGRRQGRGTRFFGFSAGLLGDWLKASFAMADDAFAFHTTVGDSSPSSSSKAQILKRVRRNPSGDDDNYVPLHASQLTLDHSSFSYGGVSLLASLPSSTTERNKEAGFHFLRALQLVGGNSLSLSQCTSFLHYSMANSFFRCITAWSRSPLLRANENALPSLRSVITAYWNYLSSMAWQLFLR